VFSSSLLYLSGSWTYGTSSSSSSSSLQSTQFVPSTASCITFDSEENVITISCRSANPTDIYNQLKDLNVLYKDEGGNADGIWLLDAGITVTENAILYINSSDTSWLKIIADGNIAHPISISGSLVIDSVKMTSWNPTTNNYTLSQDSHRDGEDTTIGTPRIYIVVEPEATGTTNITNSEIAYLGYESGYGGGRTGLRYEGADGSIIRGSNIHNLYFAFYSKGVGEMIIENNHIHDNIHYGLDPHTGTHDMIIQNNTVHDNGSIGIICSLDCYNIVIENNNVYSNTKMGIMFSKNMTDSIARNNTVSNEDRGIVISESHNNEIYNNTVSNSGSGIDLDKESFENVIHDNVIVDIADTKDALDIEEGAEVDNMLYSNILMNSNTGQGISLDQGSSANPGSSIVDEADDIDN
jgi:poly(beta-D-mannuronate) C5 epimerase